MQQKLRALWLDNLRAALMVLVVAGHLCETVSFPGKSAFYYIIYTFHMPAFCFVSGLCAKPRTAGDLARRYLYPYAVFQVLYLAFANAVLGKNEVVQFWCPYWILWYLLAMAAWTALLPLMPKSGKGQAVALAFSIAAAMLAGYEESIDYTLSLSRIVVYLPYFLVGYILGTRKQLCGQIQQWLHRTKTRAVLVALAAAGAAAIVCNTAHIRSAWLYNALPYAAKGYGPGVRAAFGALAAVFTLLLWAFAPAHSLPGFTRIGRHTLPVYLLHGFVVRALPVLGLPKAPPHAALLVLALTAACLAVLSSPFVEEILHPLWQLPAKRSRA